MKLSELIALLEEYHEELGDVDVLRIGMSKADVEYKRDGESKDFELSMESACDVESISIEVWGQGNRFLLIR